MDMNKRNKTILQLAIIGLILLAGALVLSGCDESEPRAVRERIAINANADSYVRNGYDFYFYSNDRISQTILLEGSAGNIDAEGTLNMAGAVTFQSTLSVTGDLTVGTLVTETTDMNLTGDLTVADTIDVNGDFDLDGDGFDVNITAGASIDTDGTTNVNASAGDITIEAETGDVVIKGDTGIEFDADEASAVGITMSVGATGGVLITGGLTEIGGGSYDTVDGDNDLGIAADLEVLGSFYQVGIMAAAEYAIAGESGDDKITVTIQLNDYAGSALTARMGAMWYLSEDANGDAIADGAPSGGIAVVTDGLLIEWVSELSGWLVSEADGDIEVVLEDNGADTFYFVIVMPDGTLDVSAIISFS